MDAYRLQGRYVGFTGEALPFQKIYLLKKTKSLLWGLMFDENCDTIYLYLNSERIPMVIRAAYFRSVKSAASFAFALSYSGAMRFGESFRFILHFFQGGNHEK
ncbi:hypothetical protein [Ruminococcus sp.]|uniref:hypothetical protein n=1 Tax=Ruminococcus sp. TaxID=41978 RepID=UPI003890C183